MDPVTIISGATVAFNALKKGFAIGKDLQDMSSQLTKWAGHMSDLGQAEKQVKKGNTTGIVLAILAQGLTIVQLSMLNGPK